MLIRPPFLVIVTMFSLFLFLCSSRQGQSCALLLMSIENTHVLDGLTNESNIPRSSDDLIFSKNRRIWQIFRLRHFLLFCIVRRSGSAGRARNRKLLLRQSPGFPLPEFTGAVFFYGNSFRPKLTSGVGLVHLFDLCYT